jgi:hypothetical protein
VYFKFGSANFKDSKHKQLQIYIGNYQNLQGIMVSGVDRRKSKTETTKIRKLKNKISVAPKKKEREDH